MTMIHQTGQIQYNAWLELQVFSFQNLIQFLKYFWSIEIFTLFNLINLN